MREGRAEPATSVSRATRAQTDPTRSSRLGGASPISFSRYSALGRPLVAAAAAPGARCEVGGHRQTGGIERSAFDTRVRLSRAEFLVREGRAEPATSVSRATRAQTDPTRSSRLGGASPISFSRYSALGRPLVAAAAAPGARCEVGGHRQTGGIERSAFDTRVRLSRAEFLVREGRTEPATSVSRATRAQQPTRPARAGWAALRRFRFRDIPLWGDRWWRPRRRRARAGFKQ